jgi:hypothetical protein
MELLNGSPVLVQILVALVPDGCTSSLPNSVRFTVTRLEYHEGTVAVEGSKHTLSPLLQPTYMTLRIKLFAGVLLQILP